jgi:hypothetical protein
MGGNFDTPNAFPNHRSAEGLDPPHVALGLADCYRMSFLQDLVYGDQCFECLDFVRHNGLPEPNISFTALREPQSYLYTFMPAQKDCEDL